MSLPGQAAGAQGESVRLPATTLNSLFQAEFEVLLYDLTSTCFECNPLAARKRRFAGTSGPDCVQVVIALVVTPDGFPLAYEVMADNTEDTTTLRDFIKQIETQ